MPRVLLSPKIDFVFKKIFGNEKHPEILISFLNAVMEPTDPIKSVQIKNSDIEKEHIEDLATQLFHNEPNAKQDFSTFIKGQGIEEEVSVDKAWVEKKLKRVRLKIDKDIDLYINEETYHDNSKFEIQRNGDGSINMIIKHVINYIEK